MLEREEYELLESILFSHYNIEEISEWAPVKTGSSNMVYSFVSQFEKYFLKVVSLKKFEDVSNEMEIIQFLNEENFPYAPKPVLTCDHSYLFKDELRYGVLYPEYRGDFPRFVASDVQKVATALAKMHRLSQGANFLKLRTFRSVSYDTERILLDSKVDNFPSDFTHEIHQRNNKLLLNYQKIDSPQVLVHGDLYFDNVLFEKGEVTRFLDFEQSGRGRRIDDIGIAISGLCYTSKESKRISPDLAQVFVKAYHQENPLNAEELKNIMTSVIFGLYSVAIWRVERFYFGNFNKMRKDSYRELLLKVKDWEKMVEVKVFSRKKQFIVMKFGGTSVSNLANWKNILFAVEEKCKLGLTPVLVCSAKTKVSNQLEAIIHNYKFVELEKEVLKIKQEYLDLAIELGVKWTSEAEKEYLELEHFVMGAKLVEEVSPKLHARIMAKGELLLTQLALQLLPDCELVDARSFLKSKKSSDPVKAYISASCEDSEDLELIKRFESIQAKVILTQGFIASNDHEETVILGRGGSDTSAAYIAAKLQAKELEIWTDVPGMFSANPSVVPSARLIPSLSYFEAQEMATSGAKILHPRCIVPAQKNNIPLTIKCTMNPLIEGTRIFSDVKNLDSNIKSISAKKNVYLVSIDSFSMWQEVGFLAQFFQIFTRHGVSINHLSTSESNVTVSMDEGPENIGKENLKLLLNDLKRLGEVTLIGPCASISLVGMNVRSHLYKISQIFKIFEEKKIYLMSQAASDLNLSFVIDESEADYVVQTIHEYLFAHLSTLTTIQDLNKRITPWWEKDREKLIAVGKELGQAYVYNLEKVKIQANKLLELEAVDKIFYSMKANNHPDILKQLYSLGINFECVSLFELKHLVKHIPHLAKERILFTPNFAQESEYRYAISEGVLTTVDNFDLLKLNPDLFSKKEIILRIDPGQGKGHHQHVCTGGENSKFGICLSEIRELADFTKEHDIWVVGLHAHAGSGIHSPLHWSEMAKILMEYASLFPRLKILNLGGGLSVPARPLESEFHLLEFDRSLINFKKTFSQYELWIEPGRFLVAEAGVIVSKVNQMKQKKDVHYIGLETGMNTLIRPALYGAYHHIENLSKLEKEKNMVANVVGPICESADNLGLTRSLPQSEVGDIFLIDTAGAYGRSMSSFYNLRPPAEEVIL